MSHKSFSILAFPIIFSKNVFSIRWAFPIRRLASNISRRPNLVLLAPVFEFKPIEPPQFDPEPLTIPCGPSMWFRSMVKAWSCKFSTCVVSFRPIVSTK